MFCLDKAEDPELCDFKLSRMVCGICVTMLREVSSASRTFMASMTAAVRVAVPQTTWRMAAMIMSPIPV